MPPSLNQTLLLIMGMRNNRCRESVTKALMGVSGVMEVQVNLFRSRATIFHKPTCAALNLVAAVIKAGYSAEVNQGSAAGNAGAKEVQQ